MPLSRRFAGGVKGSFNLLTGRTDPEKTNGAGDYHGIGHGLSMSAFFALREYGGGIDGYSSEIYNQGALLLQRLASLNHAEGGCIKLCF